MVDDKDTRVFLNIGDVVSIHAEGACGGFLSTLGPLDDRCVVKHGSVDLQNPLRNFLDCYFRVCSINGTSRSNTSEADGDRETHLASQLKNKALIQEHPNGNVFEQLDGSRVQYGQEIRLHHCRSNKFLALVKDVVLDGFILCLRSNANEASVFSIRAVGESNGGYVTIGDNITFSTSDAAYDLRVARDELNDQPGCNQVIASSASGTSQLSWKMSIFVTNTNITNGVLKSGDTVRIFHEAQEKFLTLDESGGKLHVFLRTSGREAATSAKSSKGLWEVEIVDREPCDGSESSWSSQFRFRHLATGQFLTADVMDDDTGLGHKLAVSSERDARSVFELEPSQITRDDNAVPQSTSVRIRHVITSTWIHSTDIPIDKDKEKPIMMTVGCSTIKNDKETFAMYIVPDPELRDLDFVIEASKALRNFITALENGNLNEKGGRSATNLLRQISHFIVGPDGGKTDTSPDRDRQKLLREQGIVSQLFKVLKVLFGVVEPDDGASTKGTMDDALREQICRQTCEALRWSQHEYRKNREYITDQRHLLQKSIGCDSENTATQRDSLLEALSGIDS